VNEWFLPKLGDLSLVLRWPGRLMNSSKFHKAEHSAKLKAIVRSLWKFNRVDPFRVTAR
jgi:hypothetical protein